MDIQKCSVQHLKTIFRVLDQHTDYVFWVRNKDMTEQIYLGGNYEKIWNRDPAIMYDMPMIWFTYLLPKGLIFSMQQCTQRHRKNYQQPEDNIIFFQIVDERNNVGYIQDQCFKCEDYKKEQYVVGFSQSIQPEIWCDHSKKSIYIPCEEHNSIKQQFFHLLKKHFGIHLIAPLSTQCSYLRDVHSSILNREKIYFSTREMECLLSICQGKTAKQIAKDMGHISPRTVETYIENIRNKSTCNNKGEIIKKFSQYFFEFELAM